MVLLSLIYLLEHYAFLSTDNYYEATGSDVNLDANLGPAPRFHLFGSLRYFYAARHRSGSTCF